MAASIDVHQFNVLLNKFREFLNSSCYKCDRQESSTKENLKRIVEDITVALRLDENRIQLQRHDLEQVISVINRHDAVFHQPNLTPDDAVDVDLVCECFRLLRNCCAGSKVNRVTIGQCSEFVRSLQSIFRNCIRISQLHKGTDEDKISNVALTVLRCGVQFVGNCISGCPENVDTFFQSLFPVFGDLMSCGDGQLKTYTSMVIYNCLLSSDHADHFVSVASGQLVVSQVLDHLREEDNEWGLYIIQRILSLKETLKRIWNSLNISERENLLEVFLLSLESEKESKDGEVTTPGRTTDAVDETNIAYVAELFSSSVDALLNLVDAPVDLHPKLVYQMLDCLCVSSSSSRLLSCLQSDSSILRSSTRLLSAVHGTSILLDARLQGSDEQGTIEVKDEGSPKSTSSFGLKRNAVRLIGNLVYKHKTNQDAARELNAIPLILDQTKIDDNNPFIVQWAVFTIRNLCEGNVENQRIVAEMRLQGLADNVTSLREFGVKAEMRDGKIIVQPD